MIMMMIDDHNHNPSNTILLNTNDKIICKCNNYEIYLILFIKRLCYLMYYLFN